MRIVIFVHVKDQETFFLQLLAALQRKNRMNDVFKLRRMKNSTLDSNLYKNISCLMVICLLLLRALDAEKSSI